MNAAAAEHFAVANVMWSTRLVLLRGDLQGINGGIRDEESEDPAIIRLVALIELCELEIAGAMVGSRAVEQEEFGRA